MEPSYSVVSQPGDGQHLHLTGGWESMKVWTYTAEKSGSVIHRTKSKIINGKCWSKGIPVEVLIIRNVAS